MVNKSMKSEYRPNKYSYKFSMNGVPSFSSSSGITQPGVYTSSISVIKLEEYIESTPLLLVELLIVTWSPVI